MHLLSLDAKDLPRLGRDPSKQLGQIVGVQPVQRAPQAVIIEHLGCNSWSQQVFNWLVRKELGNQVELPIAEP